MVRPLAKGFLIGLGAVVALGGVGMLAINLYVQSSSTQARIEHEMSVALGTPVQMMRTTVTPWSGLKISGLTVPQPNGNGNFLEASSFAMSFQFLPLFRRQLVVDDVSLNQPKVTWLQNAAGKWRLPSEAREPAAPGEKLPPREIEPIQPAEPSAKTPRFTVNVKHLRIRDGSFQFFDAKETRALLFSAVNVDCPLLGAGAAQGIAHSAKVDFRDVLFLENLRASFHFAAGQLTLPEVSAQLAAGTLGGAFALQTDAKKSPFTADLHFAGLDINQLLTEAGGPAGCATGKLGGWLDLYGRAGDPDSVNGSGHLALTAGVVQYEFFQLLGQALQIGDLLKMDLRQAEADFRIGDKRVEVDDAVLRSPNLKLSVHGAVGFDSQLKLEARLAINQTISRQLPAFIEANFQPGEEPDTRSIDFVITGTAGRPRTDLMDRILGRKIQKEVGSLFQSIFGGKNKPKAKKGKPSTSETTAAPAPAPSAAAVPSAAPEAATPANAE